MKNLHIPYYPQISGKNLAEIASTIIETGVSDMVEKVNWPEQYPGKPLTEFNILRSDSGLRHSATLLPKTWPQG